MKKPAEEDEEEERVSFVRVTYCVIGIPPLSVGHLAVLLCPADKMEGREAVCYHGYS